MSRIFISHNSSDNAVTAEFGRRLHEQGHRSVYIDFDPDAGIPAGRDWEQDLYRELHACQALIVLCSYESMASKWCFAEITHAKALGKPVFPVKIADCEIHSILTSLQIIDWTADKEVAWQRLWRGLKAAGIDSTDDFDWDGSDPPYPGLPAFREKDAAIFFGRNDEIHEGLEVLNSMNRFGSAASLLVLGASGSGKSSLVQAGVIPRLRKNTREWLIIDPFRPRDDALEELGIAISKTQARLGLVSPNEGEHNSFWSCGPSVDRLLQSIEQTRRNAGCRDARILLVVDQAEELFSNVDNEGTAGHSKFLEIIAELLEIPDSPAIVVWTLRSDFLDRFQKHPTLAQIKSQDLRVGPLGADDLAQVIQGPAKLAGLHLETGLVQRMVSDTETDDALPLLAFTLREMYEYFGEDGLLDISEYEKLGGLSGSVAKAAEQIFRSAKLSDEQKNALRSAFLGLVRLNAAGQFVRTPLSTRELSQDTHNLIERFVKARLLVAHGSDGQKTIEVAHEALFRTWGRLSRWLDKDREFLLWHRRLADSLGEWKRIEGDSSALLQGQLLDEARGWQILHEDRLTSNEHEFIRASNAHWQGRRRNIQFFSSVVVLLVLSAVVVMFLLERNRATTAENALIASQAAEIVSAFDRNSNLSRAESIALWQLAGTENEGRRNSMLQIQVLREFLNSDMNQQRYTDHEDLVINAILALNPDQKYEILNTILSESCHGDKLVPRRMLCLRIASELPKVPVDFGNALTANMDDKEAALTELLVSLGERASIELLTAAGDNLVEALKPKPGFLVYYKEKGAKERLESLLFELSGLVHAETVRRWIRELCNLDASGGPVGCANTLALAMASQLSRPELEDWGDILLMYIGSGERMDQFNALEGIALLAPFVRQERIDSWILSLSRHFETYMKPDLKTSLFTATSQLEAYASLEVVKELHKSKLNLIEEDFSILYILHIDYLNKAKEVASARRRGEVIADPPHVQLFGPNPNADTIGGTIKHLMSVPVESTNHGRIEAITYFLTRLGRHAESNLEGDLGNRLLLKSKNERHFEHARDIVNAVIGFGDPIDQEILKTVSRSWIDETARNRSDFQTNELGTILVTLATNAEVATISSWIDRILEYENEGTESKWWNLLIKVLISSEGRISLSLQKRLGENFLTELVQNLNKHAEADQKYAILQRSSELIKALSITNQDLDPSRVKIVANQIADWAIDEYWEHQLPILAKALVALGDGVNQNHLDSVAEVLVNDIDVDFGRRENYIAEFLATLSRRIDPEILREGGTKLLLSSYIHNNSRGVVEILASIDILTHFVDSETVESWGDRIIEMLKSKDGFSINLESEALASVVKFAPLVNRVTVTRWGTDLLETKHWNIRISKFAALEQLAPLAKLEVLPNWADNLILTINNETDPDLIIELAAYLKSLASYTNLKDKLEKPLDKLYLELMSAQDGSRLFSLVDSITKLETNIEPSSLVNLMKWPTLGTNHVDLALKLAKLSDVDDPAQIGIYELGDEIRLDRIRFVKWAQANGLDTTSAPEAPAWLNPGSEIMVSEIDRTSWSLGKS